MILECIFDAVITSNFGAAKLKKNRSPGNLKVIWGNYLQFKSKMEISNKKRTTKIKRIFNLGMAVLAVTALFFAWKDNMLVFGIFAAIAVLFFVSFQFVNINYVFYSSEGDKIRVRYYPVIAVFGKEYNSIEFDKSLLYFAKVKRMAAFTDLYLAIKTSKGIAEYPEVSLMGLTKEEILLIERDLNGIMKK
jgi:hypothetical protein